MEQIEVIRRIGFQHSTGTLESCKEEPELFPFPAREDHECVGEHMAFMNYPRSKPKQQAFLEGWLFAWDTMK